MIKIAGLSQSYDELGSVALSNSPFRPSASSRATGLLDICHEKSLVDSNCRQGMTTGTIGIIVLMAHAIGIATGHLPTTFHRYEFALAAMFMSMAIYELAVKKVYARNFDFGSRRALDANGHIRVATRFIILTAAITLSLLAYAILREYGVLSSPGNFFDFRKSWYAPFFRYYCTISLAFLLCAIPYFYVCEIYGRWRPDTDELLLVAESILSIAKLHSPNPELFKFIRSLLVKFFFMPLMVVFFAENSRSFEHALQHLIIFRPDSTLSIDYFALLFDLLYETVFFIDVAFCVLGYTCTLRLFDTHIRSTEPTLAGWLVALACYPPCNRFTNLYISYNTTDHTWGTAFHSAPFFYVLAAISIILLLAVYLWSTIAFGLRFSNLTNRGILSGGPYSIIRHPAYVSKNLAWWIVAVPFLYDFGDCIRLALWNGIYIARALTEERHLSNDPQYVAYCQRVKHRFIPWIV